MTDQQFQKIINQSTDLICCINEKLEIIWANETLYKTLGWLKSDFEHKKFTFFVSTEDHQIFESGITIARNKEPYNPFIISCLHKNGSTVHIQFKAQKDIDEDVFYLIGQPHIKLQKSTEELINEDKRFKSLVENSTNGIAILQPDGSTSYVSPGVVKILGYPEKEAMKMKLNDILHPEDVADVFISITDSLNNPGVPILGNLSRVKRKDGSWIWVEATITNLLHDPAINGIVDDFKDVTLTKTATEHLEKSKENYQRLFNFSPLPMFIYELDNFQIIEANEAAIQHYGYSRVEFLQMTIPEIRPLKDRHLVKEAHQKTHDISGIIQFGIFTHQTKSGTLCKMDVSGQRLIYNDKNCIIAVADDVTDKELLHGLEKLEREIMEKSIQLVFDLPTLIRNYIKGIESLFPGLMVSILKVKDNKVWNYLSPSLPKAFVNVIHGMPIGPEAGSCGTAAFLRKKVVTKDISKDKLWKDYRSIALENNLKSSWSLPVYNANNEVIATFANYYSYVKTPTVLELELFDRSAALLSLLFEHHQKSEDLVKSNERHTYINKVTNDAIYDWDVEKDIFIWSDSFQRIYGHEVKDTFRLRDWVQLMHHEDLQDLHHEWENFLNNPKQNKWMHEFRFQKEDETFAYVEEVGYMLRDDKGKAKRMFGVIRDRTTQKTELIQNKILEDVSQIFNNNISLHETLRAVLTHLSHYGDFNLAEAWLLNQEESHITLIAHASKLKNVSLFYEKSKRHTQFEKGEGLPGAVWKKGKAIIWDGLDESSLFKRQEAAKLVGLKSGLGLPILYNKKLRGVLVFATQQSEHKLRYFKDFFSKLENRLGIEIIRKKAEEEFNMFFQYSPDILCITSPEGKFSKVNPAFIQLMGYTEQELTYQPFSNFVYDADEENTYKEFNETKTGKRQANGFVNRYVTKSGEKKWISWNSSQVFGTEGLVFAYGRDVTEKKELEDLLEQANQLAQIGGWEYDLKTQEIYWSAITRSIHEVEGEYNPDLKEALEFYHEGDHRDNIVEVLNRAIEYHQKWDLELIIITANKKEKWIRIIGEPEVKDGKCIKIVGSFQDINERKLAELELQKVFKERNSILENISDGFFSVDNKWIVNYWNEKAEILLQTTRSEIINKSLWNVFTEQLNTDSYKNYHLAMEQQKPVYFDDFYSAINKWFEISAYPSENGLSVFFKDTTERKKNEELIKESNERFEMVAQATNDAIWDYNVNENILYWGGGFQKLFQHNITKIKPTFELLLENIHPDDRQRVAQKIEGYMKDASLNNWREEYRFLKGDGTYAYVIDRAIFLRDSRGEVTRVIGAMTDITYRKEIEESLKELNTTLDERAKELAKSNAELEQFAYVASHDLQEPLRMITSFMTLLSNKYGGQLDEKANKYVHFAVDGAERMRQIILDLLEFSRAGKLEQEHKKTSIKEIIEEACLLQRKAIDEKKAKIVFKDLPDVQIFQVPYLQVFQNLIGNALKYTDQSRTPKISVSGKLTKNVYTIAVKDNGIGIDKTHFDKIFVIFKRLHTKVEFKGTGMGLAIVKKIIENYGGKIWVESEPGKGSTFYFTISKNIK